MISPTAGPGHGSSKPLPLTHGKQLHSGPGKSEGRGYGRYAFPDLLTFHDAPTGIEQKLFVMFLEHRMRTFQGTFHANPDYALWYGGSEMQRDLTEIKESAAQLREREGCREKTAKAKKKK